MTNKQALFEDIDLHLQQDEMPSVYLNKISKNPFFIIPPLDQLSKLRQTEQSPIHHPEGNVWNHTMLVLDEAAKRKAQSKNARAFMWAALLHDIGKPPTFKNQNGKITAYNHDKVGAEMAAGFLREFQQEESFIQQVASLVRWHMQILFVVNNLPFAELNAMKQQADLEEVALIGLCDRLGRTGANLQQEEATIRTFLQKCSLA